MNRDPIVYPFTHRGMPHRLVVSDGGYVFEFCADTDATGTSRWTTSTSVRECFGALLREYGIVRLPKGEAAE